MSVMLASSYRRDYRVEKGRRIIRVEIISPYIVRIIAIQDDNYGGEKIIIQDLSGQK